VKPNKPSLDSLPSSPSCLKPLESINKRNKRNKSESINASMAKSTRSKTKRSFRRAKREEFEKSTYAVTHAARLERLSRKLAVIAQAPVVLPTGLSSTSSHRKSRQRTEEDEQGWPLFALLGLVDPDEIAAFGLPLSSKCSGRRRPSSSYESGSSSDESDCSDDWMSGLSAVAWQHLSESALLGSFS
jgi:hypothetical protein